MQGTRRAAAAVVLAACAAAHAATLQVTVMAPDGTPVPNVVVELKPTHGQGAALPPPPAPVVVTQHRLRFSPAVVAVPAGGSVRFVNQDGFEHHIASQPGGPLGTVPPAQVFARLMPPAEAGRQPAAEVKFESPGRVVVGCHLHGSMRAHVYVSATPWTAVTDVQGRAVIASVPAGAAVLGAWHPDQLLEQDSRTVQLRDGDTQLAVQLNFTPQAPYRR